MGYWLVVQGNLNLFEVAVFHRVSEQQTWQRPVGGASDQGCCELDDGDSPGCSGPERSVVPCPDICANTI